MAKRSKRGAVRLPGAETLELTKIDVCAAHISTAVRLFFEGAHPVPIYALASAAREILTTLGEKTGVKTTLHDIAEKRKLPLKVLITQVHKFAKFFKHANTDPAATIAFNEEELDIVLQLACHDFGRVTGGMPIEAQVFEVWIHAIAYQRVNDAPFKKQKLLKQAIKQFPGIRTSTRTRAKQLGLELLKKLENDSELRMTFRRHVILAEQPDQS